MTARLLVIMGSGETSPTMVTTHQRTFAALEPEPEPAVVMDTPFGFQENADEIVARAVRYFADNVGRPLATASLRSVDGAGPEGVARLEATLRAARFVFAGPGSPTYAVEQWRSTQVRDILAAKLIGGGAVTFASAAAVALGRYTLPVYEIYKAGRPPHWVDGLDILGALGIDAVVIPHFDNAEGGTHDTRYCYMGRRRLEALEAQLPETTSVIGVDEHTACIVDWEADEVRVAGKGAVTVRRSGREAVLGAGAAASVDFLRGARGGDISKQAPRAVAEEPAAVASLGGTTGDAEARFEQALAGGDAENAAAAVLALEQAMTDWSADTLQSDEGDKARSLLRTMIVRLGEAAGEGLVDPRDRFAPFVEALLEVRRLARDRGDWDAADQVRDRLLALGVEVRDGAAGTEWLLR